STGPAERDAYLANEAMKKMTANNWVIMKSHALDLPNSYIYTKTYSSGNSISMHMSMQAELIKADHLYFICDGKLYGDSFRMSQSPCNSSPIGCNRIAALGQLRARKPLGISTPVLHKRYRNLSKSTCMAVEHVSETLNEAFSDWKELASKEAEASIEKLTFSTLKGMSLDKIMFISLSRNRPNRFRLCINNVDQEHEMLEKDWDLLLESMLNKMAGRVHVSDSDRLRYFIDSYALGTRVIKGD
ncbi:hypothetical protein Tco_1424417, partial [Tanacetum coccineum]